MSNIRTILRSIESNLCELKSRSHISPLAQAVINVEEYILEKERIIENCNSILRDSKPIAEYLEPKIEPLRQEKWKLVDIEFHRTIATDREEYMKMRGELKINRIFKLVKNNEVRYLPEEDYEFMKKSGLIE